jgi:hypothetical protein
MSFCLTNQPKDFFNKNSCLGAPVGVTNFIIIILMN